MTSRRDPAFYDGWDDPLVSFREGCRWGAGSDAGNRSRWETWLTRRGVAHEWVSRVNLGELGASTVLEAPYVMVAPPPRTTGPMTHPFAGPGEAVAIQSNGARFVEVENAAIVGGWDVIRTRDGACFPALDLGPEVGIVSNALDQRLIGWTGDHLVLRRESGPAFANVGDAIFACGEHSTQFGHWMMDYLPRLLAVRGMRDRPATVLVDEGQPPNAIWWLRKVLPDAEILEVPVGRSVTAERLVVPIQRACYPVGWRDPLELTPEIWPVDTRAAVQLRDLANVGDAALPHRAEAPRRLWFARRSGTQRALANQDEIAASLTEQGFEVMYPEDETPDSMAVHLSETAMVVAPGGSALYNLLNARAGLRVVVLLGPAMFSRGTFAALLPALGHRAVFVGGRAVADEGRTPYENLQRPFTISVDDVMAGIADV